MKLSNNNASVSANETEAGNGRASKNKKVKPSNFTELKVEAGGDMDTSASKEQRAFNFIAEYALQRNGAEPSLEDIMAEVQCSQGSASNYRTKYRKSQLVVSSNGHKE